MVGPKSVTLTKDDIAKALQKNERSQPLDVKWESVPEGFNWAAKNQDGRLRLFVTKPRVYDNRWCTNDGYGSEPLDRVLLNSETNVCWKDSLTQRGQQ